MSDRQTNCVTCGCAIVLPEGAKYRRYCAACLLARKSQHSAAQCARRRATTATLAERLDPRLNRFLARAEIRSRPLVARLMDCSAESVRQAEFSALNKILRAFAPERAEFTV